MGSRPSVSVLVLNCNGRQHLDDCFASLAAQTYPHDRIDLALLDNGSADGSLEFIREKYPTVRVIAFESNQGVCAPYNSAIRASGSEFVALLNNDTRVEPQWLAELVSVADRQSAVAVASKILDWNGETIDFAGGITSFIGHSWRVDSRVSTTRDYDEKPLLFPCAGSALFSRSAFLDAGGFDEDYFACLEDVDLGWRLNLNGGKVVLAPKAVTFHRVNGTWSRFAHAQRQRLLERNALATIYKNYEAATLERIFPAAVALLLLRATIGSGIDTLSLALSDRPSDFIDTHPNLAAHLIALEDFSRQLPSLKRKRELVQGRRRRSDAAMFELFGDPLRLHETGGPYEDVARALIREFGIDEIVMSRPGRPSQTSALHDAEQPTVERTAHAGQPVPMVSIVILTALGATHLRECLDSLRQQTYPSDRIELIVVDNGSDNDPTGEIRARFPGAQVLRNETNIGFAAGNNQGAAAAAGDYVIFLNDDTRVDPRWVSELVGTARRRNAAAVASFILDWPGKTVDFVDGVVSFEGKGYQLQYGSPARRVAPEERPLLFACGCAMLVDRGILAEAGGWDEGAFAYYEDVELGWRLHLLGHQVWLAPRAVVYHKHHGTSERWAEPPRLRLYERNSLRAMFSLLERPSLERALPAALMLAADRALLESGLSRVADTRQSAIQRLMRAGKGALIALGISKSTPVGPVLARIWKRGFITLGRDVLRRTMVVESRAGRESYLIERGSVRAALDTERQQIPVAAAAMLSGIYGFLVDIPQLVRRRADLQRRRQKSDRDVLGSLGNQWVRPSSARLEREHRATHTAIVAEFQIADLNLRRTTKPETNPGVLAGRAAS